MTTARDIAAETVARSRTSDPLTDAITAWTNDAGYPGRHQTRQDIVRLHLPALADALDRLTT